MKPADAAMFAAADQRLIDVTREPPGALCALLLGAIVEHYADLLQRGYRATRWHHPLYGVEELMPNGGWKFSAFHPDSPRPTHDGPAPEGTGSQERT